MLSWGATTRRTRPRPRRPQASRRTRAQGRERRAAGRRRRAKYWRTAAAPVPDIPEAARVLVVGAGATGCERAEEPACCGPASRSATTPPSAPSNRRASSCFGQTTSARASRAAARAAARLAPDTEYVAIPGPAPRPWIPALGPGRRRSQRGRLAGGARVPEPGLGRAGPALRGLRTPGRRRPCSRPCPTRRRAARDGGGRRRRRPRRRARVHDQGPPL